jgi:hypothetical protein
MSDLIETELKEAFADRVDTVAPRIVDRLSGIDFAERRARPWFLAKISAAGAAVVAGATVAILAFGSGAPAAFAGWTASPARATASSVSVARRACGVAAGARVLAAESRGPFVSIVFLKDQDPWQCITHGSFAVMKTTTQYPARLYARLPADKITTPSLAFEAYTAAAKRRVADLTRTEDRLFRKHEAGPKTYKIDNAIYAIKTGPDGMISVTGTAGRGVREVRFTLASGAVINASVEDGWYEAWWPGAAKPGASRASTVSLSTSDGRRSTKVVYELVPNFGSKRCERGSACSVFAPVILKQGVAAALRSHFAFFDNTQPLGESSSLLPTRGGLQIQNNESYGIDRSQTRAIRLPGNSVELIEPGSEGVCETLSQPLGNGVRVSMSGCEDLESVLRWGEFGISGSSGPSGETHTLHGLVPNGNKTVTVKMVSGAKLVVPVHDNIVYATFSATPKWVKFVNAFGYIKRHPA